MEVFSDIPLITPDYAAIRVCYYNNKVLTRCPSSADNSAFTTIVIVQGRPCLRIIIWFVPDCPHIIILYLKANITYRSNVIKPSLGSLPIGFCWHC